MTTLFPEITPYAHGMLDIGDGNSLYWETCGNPRGKPVASYTEVRVPDVPVGIAVCSIQPNIESYYSISATADAASHTQARQTPTSPATTLQT